MDTLTQVERLIELAIIQRAELKRLVDELPQLREHLNTEIERTFEETEPQIRAELEEFMLRQGQDHTKKLSAELSEKIESLAKTLQESAQAKYSALLAEREQNNDLLAKAEKRIAEAASGLSATVKELVTVELARFPRAGEIDQLRKEFAEPRGLNPRGKWIAGETYNKLDLVTINGDSYVSNIDGNTEKPSRSAANWTLNAARGISGGGGGITSLNDILGNPSIGDIVGSEGNNYVRKTLTAGDGIGITETPTTITIDASAAQQKLTATVKNAESFAITRGQVVYLFGATGNIASVKLASNTSDATSAKTFGVVSDASIAANGTGIITCVGVQDKLTLGAYNEGDTLYLGATAGSVTNVKPYAPNHLVYVGIVERANNGNGELYVKIQNGYELDEIHDVQINDPRQAGQTLIYDATNSLWKNARLTAGVGVSILNADSSITISADGGVNYQGTWNASTNTPTLTSSVGTKGFYYVVSVAGSTNLNGVTDWKVGDWAIFNGTAWEKVDTTDQVSSVFGRTGAVVGVSTDYSSVGITNTAIGASNPSTGAFTTLSATGNLTVSGTGTHSLAGQVTSTVNAANTANLGSFVASNATLNSFTSYSPSASLDQKYWTWQAGTAVGDGIIRLRALNDAQTNGTNALTITRTGISSTAVEVGGNLTVSGTGTHSFAGPLGVTLTQNAATVSNFTNASAGASAESIVRLTNNVSTMSMGLRGSGNAAYGALQSSSGYLWYNGTTSLVIGATDAAGFIKFNTGGINETMRLFANGNLFVGASPNDSGHKLQVNGTGYFADQVTIVGTAAPWTGLNVYAYGTTPSATTKSLAVTSVVGGDFGIGTAYYFNSALWRAGSTNGAALRFRNDGSIDFVADTGLTANTDYTPTTRMSLSATGNLTVSGTGTSSLAGVLQFAATKGITFNSSTDVGTYGIGYKNDGSVYPIRVALANDGVTQRRFQVGYYSTDTQAGTWTNSFEVNGYNGNTTITGKLTASGNSSLFGASSYLDTDASTPVLAITGARSTTAAGVFTNQLNIQDTGTLAAGQGGAINFGGNASGGVYRSWGAISGAKANATATDYAGGLKFWTRVGGGSMREALHLDTALTATFAGNLTVSGSAASTIEGTLGLNCTPVTWYDNANFGTALQIGAGAGIYAFNSGAGNTQLRLYNNAYLDNGGAEKYLTNGEAFSFSALAGEFVWKYASSGTAGNAVTLGRVMSLLGNGNLIVGSGSVDGGQKLQVSGTAAITGAVTIGKDNSGSLDSSLTITAASDNADLVFKGLTTSTKRNRIRFYNSLNDEQARIQSGGEVSNSYGNIVFSTSGASGLTTALTLDSSQNATFAGRIRVSGFDSTYYNANAALIGNATYNPKLALASTLGYTWTARTNDVGGAGEFIVRYEEGSKDFLTIDRNGNTVVNSAAIATNATNGFLYVPSCAGTPTGTPTTYTGRVPIVVDTTNNKLYFYSGGAWRDAGP